MNFNNPTVSVVMSIYNEPISWITHAIDSILNQTFSNFEFIIINDNPKRLENEKVLLQYSHRDYRIIVIKNEVNIGLTKSLNKGIYRAKGKYIARMDADDISLPRRLAKQVEVMEKNNKIIVCGTNAKFFGHRNFISTDWLKSNNNLLKAQLLLGSCFIHPTVMFRKNILEYYNIKYDEDYKQTQDYRLWEQLSEYGEFYNLKEILFKYRLSAKQISYTHRTNQYQYAQTIRRRIINKWLITNNVDLKMPEAYTFNDIKLIRNIVTKHISNTDPYYKVFIFYLYHLTDTERFRTLWMSIRNYDLFRMTSLNRLRFILYVFKLRHKFVW